MSKQRVVVVFDLERVDGPPQDDEAVREALQDELASTTDTYAQDDEHEQESQYSVELISSETVPPQWEVPTFGPTTSPTA